MPQPPIIVASASNESYFPGLCVTVMSAALATPPENSIRFYILDTGLSEKNRGDLQRLLSTAPGTCEIVFKEVSDAHFKGMNTDYGGGFSTYARLLVASLVPESKVIYLDADFLVLRNLAELWLQTIHPHLMLATTDLDAADGEPKRLSCDCPFLSTEEADSYQYHNCGFLFIDLDAWRTHDIEQAAFQSVKGFENRLKAWDQTLLNYVLRGKIGRLHGLWNQSCSIDGIPGEANIHYISMRKPWNHWSPMPMYRAWYVFHKRFVNPHVPFALNIQSCLTGAARHMRDRLLTRIPILQHGYLTRMRKRQGERFASAYELHLRQMRNAHANPAWQKYSAEAHIHLTFTQSH